jgi:arylsulfatase A-like enzyme
LPPPNVLIVTVDCLRRDRLSAYGYERTTTPFLDGILERSLHCTSAHSTSSWTCPAVVSLLTGLYPSRHGGGLVAGEPKNLSKENLPTILPKEIPTLAQLLASRGYATAAISAVWNSHLPLPGRFQHMSMLERPGGTLVRRTLRWIREQDSPFLMWLHLGDAHEPLDVPRAMRNLFGKVPRIPKVRRWDYTKSDANVDSTAFAQYRDGRTRLYDVAVRSADAAIEELFRGLTSLGKLEETLVVVTSDHGEEFWEHRADEMRGFSDPRGIFGVGHGHNLLQIHLLIPLLMIGPGIKAGAVDRNASLVDISPTLLSALGLDHADLDGRSLWEPVPDDRPILAEGIAYGFEKKAVIMNDLKLLSSPGDDYEGLFTLGVDRLEAATIEDSALADRLRSHLPETSVMGERVLATEEIEQHLRDLGYID